MAQDPLVFGEPDRGGYSFNEHLSLSVPFGSVVRLSDLGRIVDERLDPIRAAFITVGGQPIRFTIGGADPSAVSDDDIGHTAAAQQQIRLYGRAAILAFAATLNQSNVDALLQISAAT